MVCFLECTCVHLYDRRMFCTAVTASRSPGIGNGLTYEVPAEFTVQLGMLVVVPLRGKLMDAIVVDVYGQEIFFEPDEERNYRAIVEAEKIGKQVSPELLKAIAEGIEAVVR